MTLGSQDSLRPTSSAGLESFKETKQQLSSRHRRKKTHVNHHNYLANIHPIQEESPEVNEEVQSFKKSLRERRKSMKSTRSLPANLQCMLNEGNFERIFRNVEKLDKNTFICQHKIDCQSYIIQKHSLLISSGEALESSAVFKHIQDIGNIEGPNFAR